MQTYPVYTFEILLFLVMPLLVLYLKGNWPLGKVIACLVVIPILWYFTYAPLHELSHTAGVYLVGRIRSCMDHTKGNYSKLATINDDRLPIPAGHCLFYRSDICP